MRCANCDSVSYSLWCILVWNSFGIVFSIHGTHGLDCFFVIQYSLACNKSNWVNKICLLPSALNLTVGIETPYPNFYLSNCQRAHRWNFQSISTTWLTSVHWWRMLIKTENAQKSFVSSSLWSIFQCDSISQSTILMIDSNQVRVCNSSINRFHK